MPSDLIQQYQELPQLYAEKGNSVKAELHENEI